MPKTLGEGAEYFTAVNMRMGKASHNALRKSAKLVRDEARRVIGTYDYGWPRLKPATIKHKAHGDTPLLETGELRRSIKWEMIEDTEVYGQHWNGVAVVGSTDPKALWHELGTSRVPPRSFLVGAALAKQEEIHKICGSDVMAYALTSRSPIEDVPDDKGGD